MKGFGGSGFRVKSSCYCSSHRFNEGDSCTTAGKHGAVPRAVGNGGGREGTRGAPELDVWFLQILGVSEIRVMQ